MPAATTVVTPQTTVVSPVPATTTVVTPQSTAMSLSNPDDDQPARKKCRVFRPWEVEASPQAEASSPATLEASLLEPAVADPSPAGISPSETALSPSTGVCSPAALEASMLEPAVANSILAGISPSETVESPQAALEANSLEPGVASPCTTVPSPFVETSAPAALEASSLEQGVCCPSNLAGATPTIQSPVHRLPASFSPVLVQDGDTFVTVSGSGDGDEALDADDSMQDLMADDHDYGQCEVSTPENGEGVEASVPQWNVYIPRGAPLYQPQPTNRRVTVTNNRQGTLYDRYHRDPRLFFVGAPSSLIRRQHPYAAEILGQAREDAIRQGRHRNVSIMPVNTYSIQRVETVTLPDGRQYSLTANWFAPPSFFTRRIAETQTSARDFCSE